MSCHTTAGGIPQRYIRGTLAGAEVERFELHLLECAECRTVIRVDAASIASRSRGRRSRVAATVAVAAVAALVAFIMARPRSDLERLAQIDPPTFRGATIRAADSTTAAIDRGMAAYSRGEYAQAARDLRRSNDSSPGVSLYLGAALLATDQVPDAIAVLRRAVETPFSPYADDARLLAAKAWLRAGRTDSAVATLRGVKDAAPVAAHARALADSIRQLSR
jgi:tetratricopeptide (TPR) repeat protein